MKINHLLDWFASSQSSLVSHRRASSVMRAEASMRVTRCVTSFERHVEVRRGVRRRCRSNRRGAARLAAPGARADVENDGDVDERSSDDVIARSASNEDADGSVTSAMTKARNGWDAAVARLLEPKDAEQAERDVKAITSSAVRQTGALLEDLASYESLDDEAGWEDYERVRGSAMRRGVALSAVAGIGVAAVTSTVSLDAVLTSVERVPPLAAFEQLLGLCVTLYYGAKYRRLLTTQEGRATLRLDLVEAVSQYEGAAALVGRIAATNTALDNAVSESINQIRAMRTEEVPNSVKQAMETYIKTRDEEIIELRRVAEEREAEKARNKEERERAIKETQEKRETVARARALDAERQRFEREAKRSAFEADRRAAMELREAKIKAEKEEKEKLRRMPQQERKTNVLAAEPEREATGLMREYESESTRKEAQAQADVESAKKVLSAEKEKIVAEKEALAVERKQFVAEKEALAAEKEKLAAETLKKQLPRTFSELFGTAPPKPWTPPDLKSEIDTAGIERELREKIESELAATRREADKATDLLMEEMKRSDTLQRQLSRTADTLNEENRVAALVEELERAKEDLGKAISVEFSLTQKLDTERKKAADLEEELRVIVGKSLSSAQQSDEKARDLTDKAIVLENELKKVNATNVELSAQYEAALTDLQKAQLQFNIQLEEVERSTKARVFELEEQTGDYEREIAELKRQLENEGVAKSEALEKVQTLQLQVAELEASVTELRKANEAMEERASLVDELADRVKALTNENEDLKIRVVDLESILRVAEEEADTMKIDFEHELKIAQREADEKRRQIESQYNNEVRKVKSLEEQAFTTMQKMQSLEKELGAQTEALEHQISDAKHAALEAQNDAKRAREELTNALRKKETDYAAQIAINTQQLAALSEEKRALEQRVSAMVEPQELIDSREECERLTVALNEKMDELTAAQQALAESERSYASEIASLKDSAAVDVEAIRAALAREADIKQKEIDRLNEQYARERSKLDEMKTDAEKKATVFEEEKRRATEEIQQKQRLLDEAKAEAEARITEITERLNDTIREKEAVKRESVEELVRVTARLTEDARAMEAAIADAAEEIETLRAQLVDAEERLEEEQAKLEGLSVDMFQLTEEDFKRKEALRDLEEESDTLRARLEDAEASAIEEADSLRKAVQEIETLRMTIEKLADIQERYDTGEAAFNQLSADMVQLLEEDGELKERIRELESDVDDIPRLRSELEEANERNSNATAEIERLEEENRALREDANVALARREAEKAKDLLLREIQRSDTLQRQLSQAADAASDDAMTRAMNEKFEKQLAEADARATKLAEELRAARAEAVEKVEALTAERETLARRLDDASEKASRATSEFERELIAAREEITRISAQLNAAEEDATLARARAQEDSAAEAQGIAERAAQDLAEAESRFSTQLEELEARLSDASQAAAQAEAKAEALAKRAAEAEAKASKVGSDSSLAGFEPAVEVTDEPQPKPGVMTTPNETATMQLARPGSRIVFDDPKSLKALSSMKRADLQEECRARGLNDTGSVPELRTRLREPRDLEKKTVILRNRFVSMKRPSGYYRTIETVRYDNGLLAVADDVMARAGVIDIKSAVNIVESAFDGQGVTEIEKNTLEMIASGGAGRYEYALEDDAAAFMRGAIDDITVVSRGKK